MRETVDNASYFVWKSQSVSSFKVIYLFSFSNLSFSALFSVYLQYLDHFFGKLD